MLERDLEDWIGTPHQLTEPTETKLEDSIDSLHRKLAVPTLETPLKLDRVASMTRTIEQMCGRIVVSHCEHDADN
jgi:hypothetical protein